MALQFVTSQIKDSAITNAKLAGSISADKLAGSIANGKLINSTVSYGGVSLALGASDATPAFDLSDATNYPTSSLVGTITNAQLAGSIANSKLANSAITFQADSGSNEAMALGDTFDIAGGTGLSSVMSTDSVTLSLDDTAVTAAAYGGADKSLTITVDAQGRLTAAAAQSISILHGAVSDFDTGVRQNRLDQMAAPTAAVALNAQKITGLADPANAGDAANKAYVDNVAQGLDVKDSVKAATTGNITLSGTQTIDGISIQADDRVLVKDQSTGTENGIYTCSAGGAWSRASDFSAGDDEAGAFTFVEQGTVNADSGWVCTNNKGDAVVGTDALVFSQFSGAGSIVAGDALTKTGNTLNVAVDGSSIEVNSDALRVKASGITNAMLAGSIAASKLAGSIADGKLLQITTGDKVAGSAVQLGSNGGLLNSTGLKVDVDDASIALTGAGKVEVKASGITLGKLGLTPKFQTAVLVNGTTTTIALTNRVVESSFRNGGWIKVFRNGQRMEWKATGTATTNSQYEISDNGSATSIVAGAAFENGDVVFMDYMY